MWILWLLCHNLGLHTQIDTIYSPQPFPLCASDLCYLRIRLESQNSASPLASVFLLVDDTEILVEL